MLMPQAKSFNFLGFNYDQKNLKIDFNYEIEFEDRQSLNFTEAIELPKVPRKLNEEELNKFLEPLSLMLGISYYKLYCPSVIKVPFSLSKEQANFWETVYGKGLGEFLYRNKLDPSIIAKFPNTDATGHSVSLGQTDQILLGIGGGKDSVVASQLLKDEDFTAFLVETQRPDPVSQSLIDAIGRPELKIKRTLDPKIFEKHEGAYNGHIPISAIFAFIGLLSAAMYGHKYVVVGNEHSSNFGNIEYKGEIINHQWSKSAEFESMLQDYTRKFMTPDIKYFSLLRQFYEIRIAEIFAKQKKYLNAFSSCNRNFKVHEKRIDQLWCGECPKCAFTFLILSAFMDKANLVEIFKKDLFIDAKLIPLFADILGFGNMKPFDCVGTFEESQAALYLASKNCKDDLIVKEFLPKIKDPQDLVDSVLKTVSAPTLPTPFRFLGIKNVCILGFGKEGRITKQYLEKNYPDLEIGILDKSVSENYLEDQEKFDLAIKTPGIHKDKVKIPYTTATNIFFSQIKNLTIGVTGSKGKSTTSTLIYEILKASGKKVSLIGNIGNPMLEILLSEVDPDEIFVIELSSFMLDDIEYSPNIAVLLNLFPEHMDFHGNVEEYYKAKKNIFKYQKPGDYAIIAPVDEKISLAQSEIPLLGAHNLENIKAAVKVAHLLNIPYKTINSAIKNFKPLHHRLELIATVNGVKFYDDAISTTPQSAIAAIKSIDNIGTIFLGGTDRGYDFKDLEKTIRDYKIKNIVLFPDSGSRILTSTDGLNIFKTKSMKDAVEFAVKNTLPGQACVLSTASPSYSLWKNFEVKGDEFKKYVLESSEK